MLPHRLDIDGQPKQGAQPNELLDQLTGAIIFAVQGLPDITAAFRPKLNFLQAFF
jgi:hypothetical protein